MMKIDATAQTAGIALEPTKTETSEDIREAAEKFEAYVASQLFKQMDGAREAMGGDASLASKFFSESFADHVADASAERGELGIADVLEKAWTKGRKPVSMEVLRAEFDAGKKE